MKKQRLDAVLTAQGLVESRNKARALIMAGKVRVNGQIITKAGYQVLPTVSIEVEEALPFVSRGGIKLAAALDAFNIDPAGMVCADLGASTGGFTDVLLQRGASRVYAIDVGYGQLAWKLRQDPRVIVMERTNARYVERLPEPIELATIDVSFISLKIIFPAVTKWLAPSASVVALVKPQFEAGKEQVGKGGVVRDQNVHRQVLVSVVGYAQDASFTVMGLIPSPITGPAGNHEFLVFLKWGASDAVGPEISGVIENCLSNI